MVQWSVVPGPASEELSSKLAERLKADVIGIDVKVFPDGESKFRVEGDVMDKRVIMVQSMYPPVDRHILQALILAHKLSEEGAQVYALIPYLGYSRQDKEFLKGEVVSLGVLARLFRSVGIKRLVTLDIHSSMSLGYFTIPTYSVSAIPLLAEYFKGRKNLGDFVAVSPDLGASVRVEAFAKVLDVEHIVFQKIRNKVTGEITVLDRDVVIEGKEIIIVDDIISTGGTIRGAADLLLKNGAKKVYAACVHPVLAGDALDRIIESGVEEVVGTNSIPSPVSKIDITSVVASYFETL